MTIISTFHSACLSPPRIPIPPPESPSLLLTCGMRGE